MIKNKAGNRAVAPVAKSDSWSLFSYNDKGSNAAQRYTSTLQLLHGTTLIR